MQIYDKALANYLLATLMKNTDYLANITYPLNKEDFAPFKAHEIIYECISALAKNGVKTIALNDICLVLKNSPKKLKQLKEDVQDLKGYLVNLSEAGNEDSFLFYYGEVRKRSLLRDLQRKGFDISRFYNPNGDKETEDNRLRDITIQDILVYWKGVQSSLEQEYDIDGLTDGRPRRSLA
jgi:replicative DNA helicase